MNFSHELFPERNKFTKHIVYTEKLFSPAGFEIVKNPRNVDLVWL